jgi:hypothetical protein
MFALFKVTIIMHGAESAVGVVVLRALVQFQTAGQIQKLLESQTDFYKNWSGPLFPVH